MIEDEIYNQPFATQGCLRGWTRSRVYTNERNDFIDRAATAIHILQLGCWRRLAISYAFHRVCPRVTFPPACSFLPRAGCTEIKRKSTPRLFIHDLTNEGTLREFKTIRCNFRGSLNTFNHIITSINQFFIYSFDLINFFILLFLSCKKIFVTTKKNLNKKIVCTWRDELTL